MDIRDVNDSEVTPHNGFALEIIFEKQTNLMVMYKEIEKFPDWPFKLNSKANQSLIKDFISRVIEELGEAHDWLIPNLAMLSKNQVDPTELRKNIWSLNEELGDMMHFMIETLIVSGIEVNHITNYYLKFIKENNILPAFSTKTIDDEFSVMDMIFALASTENFVEGYSRSNQRGYVIGEDILPISNSTHAGRLIGPGILLGLNNLSWAFTLNLQRCRTKLKNKPWKQTGVETNETEYVEWLLKSVRSLFQILDLLGLHTDSLYEVYVKKNIINQKRIKSKY